MADVLVVLLHPKKATIAADFTAYLEGLAIEAFDHSYADPGGVAAGASLGPAAFFRPAALANSRIQQNFKYIPPPITPPPLVLQLSSTATAFLEITTAQPEYMDRDIHLRIQRTVGGATTTIVDQRVHYNAPKVVIGGPVPHPVDPGAGPADDPYAIAASSVAAYVSLPSPGASTGVQLPADGSPPQFAALRTAVENVVNADPGGIGNMDTFLAALTTGQCEHIAREIIWDRTNNPMPLPPRPLEEMYTGTPSADVDRDRQRFEGDQLAYYGINTAQSDRLSRYVYALATSVACQLSSTNAPKVTLSVPVDPAVGDPSRIKNVEVILTP